MGKRDRAVRLTKRVVDAAKPRAARYELWDAELSGFGLRIEASGSKTFIVRYRADGGGRNATRRNMVVGRYGVVTPDEARATARRTLGQAAAGHDPADTKAAKRKELTIADLFDLYEAKGCVIQRGKRQGHPMKPMTKRYTLGRLRHHVLPLLGRKKIGDVRAKDIEQFVRDVAAGKTAKDEKIGKRQRIIVRGGDGAARKVVRDLSAMFTFAQRQDLVKENPCEHAAINKVDNQRKVFLSLDQLRSLGKALGEIEKEGVNPKAINIARLWALTGFRRNEAAGLRRSEVDFARGGVRLADTKEGVSIRPLGAAALILLRSIDAVEGSDYFFPAERGATFYQGTKRVWPAAIQKAKLKGITPHTLRHTLGSTAVSSGETLKMAGAILGHATVAATEVYAHLQIDPSKRVADRVSATIAAALAGDERATIVPMRRRAKGV